MRTVRGCWVACREEMKTTSYTTSSRTTQTLVYTRDNYWSHITIFGKPSIMSITVDPFTSQLDDSIERKHISTLSLSLALPVSPSLLSVEHANCKVLLNWSLVVMCGLFARIQVCLPFDWILFANSSVNWSWLMVREPHIQVTNGDFAEITAIPRNRERERKRVPISVRMFGHARQYRGSVHINY